jgi:hypothetical protein
MIRTHEFKLTYDRSSERDRNRAVTFAQHIVRTVSVDGEFGFKWATINSSEADMQAAFDGWQDWPTEVMDAWVGGLYLVSQPPGEAETQSGVDPNA